MPRENKVVNFFADAFRQGALSHVEDAYADGFNTAANLSIDLVTAEIDRLITKISEVGPLNDGEQVLLAGLMTLRTDLDRRFRTHPSP